jgi:hypothetical protein
MGVRSHFQVLDGVTLPGGTVLEGVFISEVFGKLGVPIVGGLLKSIKDGVDR